MSSLENPVTLENPTREFLNKNFKKTDLQKICREMGITKVWYTKDRLIDLLLEKHRTVQTSESEIIVRDQELTPQETRRGMEEIRERINIRDLDIDELNELVKTANITINRLNDRVSSLEEQVKILQDICKTQQTTPATQEVPNTTPLLEGSLLLGDTNLSSVRRSDLHQQCSVRTIKGANIDLINCWVKEKLHMTPRACILYCGIQDIFDGSELEDIFDGLGSLIANLKQTNERMEIFICELAPVPQVQEFDEKINNFNNQLPAWGESNGIKVIKTNLQYRLGTGDIDQMCYDGTQMIEGKFLNRFGIIRLLNIIASQCPFLKLNSEWNKIMNQYMPTPSTSQRPPTYKDRLQKGIRRNRSDDHHHQAPPSRLNQNSISDYPRRRLQQGEGRYGKQDFHHQDHQMLSRNKEWRRNSDMNLERPMHIPQRPQYEVVQHDSNRRRPCYNCGETNSPVNQESLLRRLELTLLYSRSYGK